MFKRDLEIELAMRGIFGRTSVIVKQLGHSLGAAI
jgi:hypothetical protein